MMYLLSLIPFLLLMSLIFLPSSADNFTVISDIFASYVVANIADFLMLLLLILLLVLILFLIFC